MMKNKTNLFITSIIASLMISCTGKQAIPPNVILILADDQGWGATTVVMDKLFLNRGAISSELRTLNAWLLGESCFLAEDPKKSSLLPMMGWPGWKHRSPKEGHFTCNYPIMPHTWISFPGWKPVKRSAGGKPEQCTILFPMPVWMKESYFVTR